MKNILVTHKLLVVFWGWGALRQAESMTKQQPMKRDTVFGSGEVEGDDILALKGEKNHSEGGSPEPPKEKIGVKERRNRRCTLRLYHSVLAHYPKSGHI